MHRLKLCAPIMILCLTLPTIVSAETTATPADTVAEVNGLKISRQDYYGRLERMPMGKEDQQVEAGMVALRDLINERLLLMLADKRKCTPTDEQVNERYAEMNKQPQFQQKMKDSGLTTDQAKDLVRILQAHFNLLTRGITVPDKDVRDYYEKNKKTQFIIPENVEVAAIFCEKKEDADKAMDLLKKSAEFATVAKELSSDPASRERGGRLLRPVLKNDPYLPPEVWKKVLATKVGKYTEPISDQTGSVIFRVLSRNPAKVQTFPEVRFFVWDSLMREKGQEKWDVDAELSKFREESQISIMIERYRDQLLPKDLPGSTIFPEKDE